VSLGRLRLASALVAVGLAVVPLGRVEALEDITVKVNTWTSDTGHAYVGVQAAGQWAPPDSRSCIAYYSVWNHRATVYTKPIRDEWFVFVHTCSGSVVNVLNPIMVITSRTSPGIGIQRRAAGLLRLDLGVTVDPVSAPATTTRTVSAALTGDWLNAIGDAISAYVVRDSVRVQSWTVDFGDGTVRTIARDAELPDGLVTTHAYGAGQFSVTVTAHLTGDAYGAFFAPNAQPAERIVPFSIDITNSAAGIAGLPIDYVPPVVTVGGSPSGTLPNGVAVPPDVTGHAALWWPRGLPCDLLVRPIIEREGFMRSGGLVIGGATTRLLGYRYEAGTNDASAATASGTYPAAAPIRIQWDTPLPGTGTYPVRLVLDLETTYADGTVRTSQVSGTVAVTVVYSAVSQ
jgi:hypothetical protein